MTERRTNETDQTLAAPIVSTAAGASSLRPEELLAGRYELLGLLGTGGMGAVYRVRDTELGEIVALKMLHAELVGDGTALDRFRQEVRLARRVTHRNVARTFDIGEHRGEKFLTMELVDGSSLGALLAEHGALSPERVVSLVEAVSAGLSAAHAAGVVHRDLKPDNILIARDGRVVVTDFGIAHAAEGAGAGKGAGLIVGTPAYMAPEQLEPREPVDRRADVYALGAVIFEMLTGAPAWPGDSLGALLAARRSGAPRVDPRTLRPSVSAAMAAVVARCMAPVPADRFSEADDVARAMYDALAAAGTAATMLADGEARVVSPTRAGRPSPAGKTVAVLPLRNAGPPEDEYLADGFTDDLIDTLSMTRGLRVRPRGVVVPFKGRDDSPAEIGQLLGVQVIVEGTVRRAGTSVRASVRLISAADGFQLWARRFDTQLSALFVATDDVARAIAEALTTEAPAYERPVPATPAAVELYLRAKFEYWRNYHAGAGIAADLFEQALALDPANPKILAGCALAYARMVFWGEGSQDAVIARGRELTDRAVVLAPDLGDAWAAQASFRLNVGDLEGAGRAMRSGLPRAPGSALLQEMLGRLLLELGVVDEAIVRLQIGVELDPTLLSAHLDLARAHAIRGEWAAADAQLDRSTDREESIPRDAQRVRLALWRGGPVPFEPLPPGTLMEVAGAAITTGRITEEQRRLLRSRAAGASARLRPFFLQRETEVYAFIGDVDATMSTLAEAVDADLIDIAWMDLCPPLARVRDDPRWLALRAVVAARAARILEAIGR